jgi:hypothetical protein
MRIPGFTAEVSLLGSRHHDCRATGGALHHNLSLGALPAQHKDKPGTAGWIGVHVGDFLECMSDCEKGAKLWEVWVHGYCVVKCAIRSGTAGGPIFK